MISLPDELLARVDAEAKRRGTTRSGVLRSFAQLALDERTGRLAVEMAKLDRQVSAHGGDVVGVLKASRPR